MLTADPDAERFLIRAYQYVIARFDIDAFRIDTLRYLKGNLAQTFGNAIREFALSIGKKNFFTFGEVLDGRAEEDIARFIGRNTSDPDDLVGVDAALDYPLFNNLRPVVKGQASPVAVAGMYQRRKEIEGTSLARMATRPASLLRSSITTTRRRHPLCGPRGPAQASTTRSPSALAACFLCLASPA